MGMTVRIPGAVFANPLTSLSIPDRTGLVAEYVFGGSFDESKINLADPASPLTLSGAPTYTANSALVKSGTGGFGFITGLTPLPARTEILIRKTSTGYNDFVIVGQAALSFGFGTRSATLSIFRDGENNGTYGAQRSLPAVGTTHIEFGVSTGASGSFSKMYAYPSGTQQEFVSANPKLVGGQLPTLIGGATLSATGTQQPSEVMYYARFHRVLTTVEIEAVYQSLKRYMALRGIVI